MFALIGGHLRHGGGGTADVKLPFPAVFPPERTIARMAASGRYRAVIAGLSGKVALPAAYAGARVGKVPFVLWATIWRHPRTPAHALSYLPLRHIYRHADAIATYGPHVSAYVRTKHPKGPVLEAPQSVDTAFWDVPGTPERHGDFQILFAGRPAAEKGFDVLERAVGEGTLVVASNRTTTEMRNLYAGSDVVVVPSVPTRDFLEPWGLVVNEAFHQGVPVIATDAVGAAAGGLVRHERTGLVVPAGDAAALRAAHRTAARRSRVAPPSGRRRTRSHRRVHARRVGGRYVPSAHERAASVNSPMRRTIFLALLAALLFAPVARATPPIEIQRDCADDGALQGSYSASDLRKARNDLPTDADEYSDCRDVLSRAIAAKTTSSKPSGDDGSSNGSDQGSGGGNGNDNNGDSGGSGTPTPESTAAPAPTSDPNATLVPSSPQDNQALADAAKSGGDDVRLGEGEARAVPVELSASVGRNGVPLTLVVLLALFALAAVTVAGPAARRLAHARRKH